MNHGAGSDRPALAAGRNKACECWLGNLFKDKSGYFRMFQDNC